LYSFKPAVQNFTFSEKNVLIHNALKRRQRENTNQTLAPVKEKTVRAFDILEKLEESNLLHIRGTYSLPGISLPGSSLPGSSLPGKSLPGSIWQILSGKRTWQIFYLVNISQGFFFTLSGDCIW